MRRGLWALALALWPPAAGAQTPPLIELPAPAPVQAPPAPVPAPARPPAIGIDPGAVPVPDPPVPPAAVVERDRAAAAPAGAPGGWVLPLTPAGPLPQGVQVGASLPAPGVLRLTGETAATELVLTLPPMAVLPEALVLSLRSSVNVLPETAALRVGVNGAAPVDLPLANPGGFAALTLPAALGAGENRISLAAIQPHRIWCGPEATFGVWTEIDLAHSGARVEGVGADAAGFAAALRAQAATGLPVPILAAGDADPAVLRALALALGGGVEVQSFYRLGPDGFAHVALIASDRAQAGFRRGASGAVVLVVEHAGADLPDLSALLPAVPLPSTPALAPGAPVRFADLGVGDFTGNTHYFSRDIAFGLPGDWLLMANQKAHLTLHHGFAGNLPEGALLLVKVNGRTVRLLPLDRDGGRLQEPLDISFPANLLRPGANAVTFEMMVPGGPADSPCMARRADMLVVLGDSTLDIPASPRMREPGLAQALAGLGGAALSVPEGAPGKAALDRALPTLAAVLGAPLAEPAARMQVVGVEGAALIPLEATGVPVRQVQDVLLGRVPVPQAGAAPVPGWRLSEEAAAPAPQTPGLLERLGQRLARAVSAEGWAARQGRAVAAAFYRDADGPLTDWLAGRTGQALLLRPDPAEPGELWLVLAPDARMGDVAAALDRLRRDGPARGEAALLLPDGRWQSWSPGRPPVLEEPPTLWNFRAVAGNYASWSPLLFAVAMLAMTLLSVLPALLYIIVTRRRAG